MTARAALVAVTALAAAFVGAAPASAETTHFSEPYPWNPPIGMSGAGCPAYLAGDYALFEGTGNGVTHDSIDRAGGFHAATTFTGAVTITLYDPANVDVTSDGDDIEATPTGPADAVWTGFLTQSFEQSGTANGATFSLTASFDGTDQGGQPISLHITQHETWTPGSIPFSDSPRTSHSSVRC